MTEGHAQELKIHAIALQIGKRLRIFLPDNNVGIETAPCPRSSSGSAGINVKVIEAISEELFDRQPEAYRQAVLPPEAAQDLMFVMSGTRRMWPLRNVGSLTDEYSLTADQQNVWLTGGTEADVIAEAHLDPDSIFAGVQRFAQERPQRLSRQRALLEALG